MTDPSTHLFWIISRGAGTTAMILASATIGYGLVMSGKLIKGSGLERRVYHEVLSLAVMVAIAVHGLALVGDSYLRPSLLDVSVPFVFSYKTVPTSIGIIAGWALIFLGLSYYLRARIGNARWRIIHRFTLLAWAGGLVHTFTEGTDAGQAWFIALIGLTAAPALVLLVWRIAARRRRGSVVAPAGAPRAPSRGASRSASTRSHAPEPVSRSRAPKPVTRSR